MNPIAWGIPATCAVFSAALLSLAASAQSLPQNSVPAGTTTRTASFMVSVMVDNDCMISNSNTLQFGHVAPVLGASTGAGLALTGQTTHFSVVCSKNTRYTLYLNQGSTASSTVDRRLMSGSTPGNMDQLQYQLYLDPACSTIWGDGASGSAGGISGVGSGSPQLYTVYGRILPQDTPNADLYSSIITASLTF